MIALGIDVSTKKIAIAGIRDNDTIVTKALELNPKARGARRLVGARLVARAALSGHASEACMVVVENPMHARPNMGTLGIAFVVIEAAQAACPNAVVMDCPPSTWRKSVLGHGRADKDDALRYVKRYGYLGNDDDIAEALCLAQLGWDRWNAATTRTQDARAAARRAAA